MLVLNEIVSVAYTIRNILFSVFTGAIAYVGSRYNPGTGPVHIDEVGCSGTENSINTCRRTNYGYVRHNCQSHFKDASVLCPTCMNLQ